MQYTIRGIPAVVDDALRARARAAGKSLNGVVVAAPAGGRRHHRGAEKATGSG